VRAFAAFLVCHLMLVASGSVATAQSPRAKSSESRDVTRPSTAGRKAVRLGHDDYYREIALATQFELIEPSTVVDADAAQAAASASDETAEIEEVNQATLRHLNALRRPINSITLTAGVNQTDVPFNVASELDAEGPARLVTGSGTVRMPAARYSTCLQHQPLYYEDANLERCGIGHGCWQTACSGTRFLTDTFFLAYKMGRQHPCTLVCPRGDCQSCQSFHAPLKSLWQRRCDARGVLLESAALAGFSLLLL
jgi:hypothetical protein